MLAPFAGPLAGIASFLLARKALALMEVPNDAVTYDACGSEAGLRVFSRQQAVPLFAVPPRPIGRVAGDTLLLDDGSIREGATAFFG